MSSGLSPYGAVGFVYHATNHRYFAVDEGSSYAPGGPERTGGAELDNALS